MAAYKYIMSLRRAVKILRCFNPLRLEFSGVEIAREVGIHKTTAYRILETLAEDGVVERNRITGKYMIGPTLYILGSLYLSTTDVLKAADSVIKELNILTKCAVNVGILEKGNVVLIMKEESRLAFRHYVHVGSILPAYVSSIGKCLLSQLSEQEIDIIYPREELLRITKHTISTKEELKDVLKKVRECNLAIAREEYQEGVNGIGSLVRDEKGNAIAAISFTIPSFGTHQVDDSTFGDLIKMGASLISYRLGYKSTDTAVCDIKELNSWWRQNQSNISSDPSSI